MKDHANLDQNFNKLDAQLSRKSRFFTRGTKRRVWLTIFIVMSALLGCQRDSSSALSRAHIASSDVQKNSVPSFYASTWILTYMAQRLLSRANDKGDQADVRMITPLGQDPARYVPDTQTLLAMQSAHLIILNGALFERGLQTVSLPMTRVLKTASALRDQWLEYPQGFSRSQHQHGPKGKHDHQGVDGHTWLDPHLLRQQLTQMKIRISQMRPTSAPAYAQLIKDIDRLDQFWLKLSIPLRQRELISNHPAYQYIARRYQLKITPFDLSPDETPSASQTDRIRQHVHQHLSHQEASDPSRPVIMLWETSPSPDVRKALSSLPLIHIVLHTLEQPPPDARNHSRLDIDPLLLYIDQLHELASTLEITHER